MGQEENLILVGQLSKPFGLKGELELKVLSDYPQRFQSGAELIIEPAAPGGRIVTVEYLKKSGKKNIIKFKGVNERDVAEDLRGGRLFVPEKALPPLPPNTYWRHQLIGLRVETTAGEKLGRISEILVGSAHDVYVVGNGGYLIPAVTEVVKEVDLKAGIMVVEPPPGLLEI